MAGIHLRKSVDHLNTFIAFTPYTVSSIPPYKNGIDLFETNCLRYSSSATAFLRDILSQGDVLLPLADAPWDQRLYIPHSHGTHPLKSDWKRKTTERPSDSHPYRGQDRSGALTCWISCRYFGWRSELIATAVRGNRTGAETQ